MRALVAVGERGDAKLGANFARVLARRVQWINDAIVDDGYPVGVALAMLRQNLALGPAIIAIATILFLLSLLRKKI